MDTALTREFLWQIPTWYSILMYALFLIALIILVIGLKRKIDFVTDKSRLNFKDLFKDGPQIGRFLKTLLLSGKTPR